MPSLVRAIVVDAHELHITGYDQSQSPSNHSRTDASVRQAVTAASAVPVTGPARLSASRLVSRSTVAYRFVVSTLACPSQWLIVTRSTPARRRWTAAA